MTELNLGAIEARANAALMFDGPADDFEGAAWASVQDVPALVARVRELEAGIKSALDVAGSSSVPLGVTEARHWDRLLAETRRVLFNALEGASDE